MLHDSDTGYFLDGLSSFFEMAPNFIGLVLWCQNFNGCAGTREKIRGAGVDEAGNQWVASFTPTITDPELDIDYSRWVEHGETKGASQTALFAKYSTTVTKNGEVQHAATVNQPNVIITEPILNSKGENENLSIISQNVPRNYLASNYGKRDIVVKDANGNWVGGSQYLQMLMRLCLIAMNDNNRTHFAMTLESVSQVVAAGAVDQEDWRGRKRSRGLDVRTQMGKQQRFFGRQEIPWVTKVSNMLGRDVTSTANHAAFVHGCGFFGHRGQKKVKAGTETTWQDVIISLVHSHTCFMNDRARCPQNWPRITEMARTRSVPYGMRLHATNALLHPSAKNKTWHDIQQTTLVNFMADPVPAQTMPVFLASLLYSSLDWLYFAVIGSFCKYFEVPTIDAQIMERVFSDPTYKVPEAVAKPVRRWFENMGIGGNNNGNSKFETIVAPLDASNMEKSGVYVTTVYQDGEEFSEGSLTFNIEPPKSGGFSEEIKAMSSHDRLCTAVAKLLVKEYTSHFRGACNISDSEQGGYKAFRPIAECLIRYSTTQLHYHRFGRVPSGRGFTSFNSVLRAFGISSGYSGAGFKDAAVHTEDYKIAPFLVRQASGNIMRFGVGPRELLQMAAAVGQRPKISQSSVCAMFHHLTEQFMMHRVPLSLYPSNHIFTSLTCSENGGFAYTKLPDHERPMTFIRPTPDCIVLDSKSSVCCGLLNGLRMPEDCYMAEPAARLASSVSDENCTVEINDVVLPCLRSPTIPVSQYVYCEIRFGHEGQQDSSKTYPAVIFTEESIKAELYVNRDEDVSCQKLVRLDNGGAFKHDTNGCSKTASVQKCLQKLCSDSIGLVTSPNKEYYIHWQHTYSRPGILLEVEIENGCTVYGVLKQWDPDDVDCKIRFFNPNTLGYLCVLEGIDGESAIWPREVPIELSDCERLFQREEMFWNVPACLVEELRVPIGRRIYLDANSEDAQKLVQGDISKIGFLQSPKVAINNVARGATLEKFEATYQPNDSNGRHLPVITVTLVYELPPAVLSVAHDNSDGLGVYVGFHVQNQECKRHLSSNIQYGVVRARHLITESRLHLMNIEPVCFAFFE